MKTIRHLTVYSMLLLNTLKPMIIESGFENWNPYCLQRMPEEILFEIVTSATGFSQEDLKAAPYYEKCVKINPEKITLTPAGNSLIVAYQNIIKTLSLVNKELYTTLSTSRKTLSSSKQELHGNPLLNFVYFIKFSHQHIIEQDELEHRASYDLWSTIQKCPWSKKPCMHIKIDFCYDDINEKNTIELAQAMKKIDKTAHLKDIENLLITLKHKAFKDNKTFDPTTYIYLLSYFNKIIFYFAFDGDFAKFVHASFKLMHSEHEENESTPIAKPENQDTQIQPTLPSEDNNCKNMSFWQNESSYIPYKIIESFINMQKDNQ